MRVALVCLLVWSATAHAEHLPVRLYNTSDGLANDRVDHCARDEHGFMWFATFDGVSRFDGHAFESFGIADGLAGVQTNAVRGLRDGTVWVASDNGLAWLDPSERVVRPHFHTLRGRDAIALAEDAHGVLWVGNDDGLARVVRAGDVAIEVPVPIGRREQVITIVPDARDDSLWIGTWSGLVHRTARGTIERYRITAESDDRVFSLALDHADRLWIGHVDAKLLAIPTRPGQPLAASDAPLWQQATTRADWIHAEPEGWIRRKIYVDSRGTVWIGTTVDLLRYDERGFETLGADRVGVRAGLAPCAEDTAGNVWFGSDTRGVARLARDGIVSYDPLDGLDSWSIYGFVETGDAFYALPIHGGLLLARRDGGHFVTVRPQMPTTTGSWGWGQTVVYDRDGRWWWPSSFGLRRFPARTRFEDLATATPQVLDQHDGLPGRDVFRIYADRRGDVWISTMSATGLVRWDRASDRIVALRGDWPHDVAVAFAEDATGALWIGYGDGHLVRVRDGVPRVFDASAGLPDGSLDALVVDRAGRLWIGSDRSGVARVDDPTRDALHVVRYTKAQGLASEQVWTLVDDTAGRIYIGTTHGIDRLDPATGAIGHFGVADGLPDDFAFNSLRARDGTLWFGTKHGAAHLVPSTEPAGPPPEVRLTKLDIDGRARPLLPNGEVTPPALELSFDEDQVDIAFTAPSFAIGAPLRFQYRFDDAAWSPPVAEHVVHFAKLATGHYRFEVRVAGARSAASLELAILPPFWRRWWFVTACALVLAALGYAAYRWRLAHALAIERVRTRIASDLHDDLGSSLSRIAILSELADRRSRSGQPVDVSDIGQQARELVDVASDIAWSTDPRRDDLGSLIVRLRGFASDVLESRGITWSFAGPPDPHRIKLDPDRRRHLYMILKEAIHNTARHAGPTHVDVAIAMTDHSIDAHVRDDGCGFDPTQPREGNGLGNMRARAAEAAARLDVDSEPGRGTTVALRMPLG